LDAVEKLLGRKVSDAVQQVKAKLPEGADGADTPLDSVKNAVSSFFKNPEEIQSTLRTGLSQLKAGVQGQLTDVMSNPSGTLENVVSNPSGALDSVMDTSRGVLGPVKRGCWTGHGALLQDAKNVFNDIKGNLPQPRGAGALDDEFGDDTLMQDASDFRVSSFLKNSCTKNDSKGRSPFPDVESREFVNLNEPQFVESTHDQHSIYTTKYNKETEGFSADSLRGGRSLTKLMLFVPTYVLLPYGEEQIKAGLPQLRGATRSTAVKAMREGTLVEMVKAMGPRNTPSWPRVPGRPSYWCKHSEARIFFADRSASRSPSSSRSPSAFRTAARCATKGTEIVPGILRR
jgi:hypothetical protein